MEIKWYILIATILCGIIALVIFWRAKKDADEHPMPPGFENGMSTNEAMTYLSECIKKATPNLSKIENVDETLAEIRGDYNLDKKVDDNFNAMKLRRELKKMKDNR